LQIYLEIIHYPLAIIIEGGHSSMPLNKQQKAVRDALVNFAKVSRALCLRTAVQCAICIWLLTRGKYKRAAMLQCLSRTLKVS
jgi:hypothetical protein